MRLKLGVCLLVLSAIVGCKEVTIEDGRVPQEYLGQAQQLAGKYQGTFDGKTAEVEIYFEGDRPHLAYQDNKGSDPLDPSCHSQIDLLKKVILVKKKGQYIVDQAFFGFHPGSCRSVRGRHIILDFSGLDKFDMAIYEYSDYVNHCDPYNYPNNPNCRTEEIPHYITGKFTRSVISPK